MGKADKHIRNFQAMTGQLNPFKNRKNYDFMEMIEHSRNQANFTKILNKKHK